jgi:hypothetical protein
LVSTNFVISSPNGEPSARSIGSREIPCSRTKGSLHFGRDDKM